MLLLLKVKKQGFICALSESFLLCPRFGIGGKAREGGFVQYREVKAPADVVEESLDYFW